MPAPGRWHGPMRMDEADRIGRDLAASSCGVVTATELKLAGIDLTVLPRLVACGRWQRLWRGVYVTDPHPAGPLTLAQAAIAHAARESGRGKPAPAPVVTGLAGARALGMRWVPESERVQVLVGPHVQRPSNEQVLVRRAADLSAVTTWQWGAVSVAEPARLVVDGARECRSLRDVRGLVLAAVADGHADPEQLLTLLDSGAVGGTAWARRAARDAQRGAASPPEAELVDGLIGCGHPFYANATVHVGGRFVGILDVYLVGTGVGGEMDSKERHGQTEQLDDTLNRHEHAYRNGVSLVHVTPTRYRADPDAYHRRLLDAVAERRARGLGEPDGLVVTPRGPLLGA